MSGVNSCAASASSYMRVSRPHSCHFRPNSQATFLAGSRIGAHRSPACLTSKLRRGVVRASEGSQPGQGEKEIHKEEDVLKKVPEPSVSKTSSALDALEKMGIVEAPEEKTTMKKTLSALDAMLGIEEEDEEKEKEKEEKSRGPKVEVSPEVLEQLKQAELGRMTEEERIEKVYSNLKKITDNTESEFGQVEADKLQKEFESLVEIMGPELLISKEDVKVMLNKVFGFNTFWVTDNGPNIDMEGGWIFRGNLRAPREEVFSTVRALMVSEFGDKYELRMIKEPPTLASQLPESAPSDKERVSFVVVLSALNAAQPTTSWQLAVAVVLASLTVLTAVQLGLVAEITRLPAETVAWLSSPEAETAGGILPPGLEEFDPIAYFDSAMPITLGVLASAGAHELSHVLVGLLRGVKLGPPFLIPNGQLGTFGAITQIKSRIQTRTQLWDVSAAGPVAGGLLGLAIFVNGLVLSTQGGGDLIPVPLNLLQGSLLLGGVTSALLGIDPAAASSTAASTVLVHPLLIAGWCALTTTALNLLPVGCLDGGRMSQASFGKRALGLTGLLTYFGLALGFIGTSLSLPFGLYILLTQRTLERAPCDDVSPVNSTRFGVTVGAIVFALLVLLPLGVEVADPLTNMPL
eukprot:CAMPEP_0196577052 /NCGR_PEP_ID=MMETSP1081-20130531/6194_1 /TAXON_ID=36882 /ORGANISM="Pyramimonas amylifera, Strain CCMP720" /LENGTH=633 /DNA_ID=CAMNT_0041895857 /DNA_START=61 /DNA_END=1962 /DNA_ORIENTATION=-